MLHNLWNHHSYLTKGDLEIILCGPRLWPWTRRYTVWLRHGPDAPWQDAGKGISAVHRVIRETS